MRKSITEQLSAKYQNSFRLTVVTFIIAIVFVLNQAHNGQIANETKGRDNSYYSWRALTAHDSFFSAVSDRDIFISNSQNDAYETNAGSFYHFTGKRLVYLFRTVSVWPEFENCKLESDCVLDRARERVVNILPTLNRLGPDPQNERQMTRNDWVKENLRPGILDRSKIWLFDIFPMTANTLVAYLGQNLDNNLSASINAQELRVATLTRGASLEFRPSMSGLCLEEVPDKEKESKRKFRVDVKLWRVPQNDLAEGPKVLDFRSLNIGTC